MYLLESTAYPGITIYERVLPANNTPSITVSGRKNIVQGTLCTLTVATTDPDTGQTLTVSLSGNPDESYLVGDSLFVWEPPETFIEDTTVLFIVTDNGTPPLSDTEKVTITVSEPAGNGAPQWNVDVLPVNINITTVCTLVLENLCEDPDGDELSFTLVAGEPSGDEITEGIYRFASTEESAGSYNVKIVVSDPDGEKDTLSVALTVDASETDTTAPAITVVSPSDSAAVSSATVEIDVICFDASGITSVTASTGGSDVELQEQDGHYKGAVSGLSPGGNTITIVATDASPEANEKTITIQVIYTSTCTVTYNGNGNTSGDVPTDETRYEEGTPVTVRGNTGGLTRDGFTFAGWNTEDDGTGTAYAPDDTFEMGGVNVTLYAQWTQTVTYVLGVSAENGSVTRSPELSEYTTGTVVTLTPVPEEGYHFTGWSGALSGSDNPATIIMDGAKSVTALFEVNQPNTFSLTVYATNGTVEKTPDQVQYATGTEVDLKATPDAGYGFVNWSGDADGTSDETTVTMDEAKTVTANFELLSYTLTVSNDGNGTTEPTATESVTHGVAQSISATAAEGYEFVNWTVTAGTATIADENTATTEVILSSGDATVRANFTAQNYTLTVANDGHGTTNPDGEVSVTYDVARSISATAAAGYEFADWTVTSGTADIANESSDATEVTLTSGDATVTANFTAETYTVKFDTDGGSAVDSQLVTFGAKATQPSANPTKSGNEFAGWYPSKTSTMEFDFNSAITGPTKIYARWTPVYTVTYDANGGSGSVTDNNTYKSGDLVTVKSGSSLTRAGYTFEKWTTEQNGTGSSYTSGNTFQIGSESVKLWAQWKRNQCTIGFDGNGATTAPSPTSKTIDQGTAIGTFPTAPEKTAYTFYGWWTGEGGTGDSVTTSKTFSSSTTLYAKWVIMDADGNLYTEVKIGSQYWMVENLRVTRYNDNLPIGTGEPVTDTDAWVGLTSGAYCYYDNATSTTYRQKWGALYNLYAVQTGKLAPEGWRVATEDDWIELEEYLETQGYTDIDPTDDNSLVKALASKTDWKDTTIIGAPGHIPSKNNSTGFTALPAGMRSHGGSYLYINDQCFWWTSSTGYNNVTIGYDYDGNVILSPGQMPYARAGFSVRLIRE